ncbi:cross-pathway control protein A [Aspergillus udagawae]|uniref:Cross-pathway control protein A n=2 Tax=Aspergillus udagawae TaxID=91492 RepID=A0ABQ1ABA0_9EURO|nr:cross-pathway control protein A [Aspergillus udagawae]GFF77910.1 cross-pathway control protein A [Aspergillus udagawae]GFG21503.1 cross-pathway control protein A [Aspergillus udagawae]
MPPWGVLPRARRTNRSGTWSYDSHLLTASRSAIPTRTSSSFSRETDTIDPLRSSSLSNISSQPYSESPVPGPLNLSIASRSSSSSLNILPFDVTSFTTDNHQQSWLPTPPPQQPTAQNLNSNSNDSNSSPQEDFVLYPTPCPQPLLRDSRAPVLPSTAPRSVSYNPFLVRPQYQQPRRHSLSLYQHLQQQKLSGSPVQVPRATRLHSQSTGYYLSSSLRSSPSSRTHFQRVHAASAPSNSPNPNRPPVPLFSAANGTQFSQKQLQQLQQFYHRRIMSTPNIAQDMSDFFGLPSNDFGDDFELSTEPTMLSPHQIPTGLMAAKDSVAGAPSGTISPKDLFMDASAPPSTSFTDLSTPSFESPGYFSQDTSPMFPTDLELGPGSEEWGPLFPAQDDFSTAFDSAALDVALALSQPEPKPAKEISVPPSPAVRNSASPAPSPAPSKSGVKHSTVAGVNARQRKPLPPIKIDTSDPVALKRARNTEAARKSRARKLERQDEMERRIRELEKSLEEAQQREQYWKALAQNRG